MKSLISLLCLCMTINVFATTLRAVKVTKWVAVPGVDGKVSQEDEIKALKANYAEAAKISKKVDFINKVEEIKERNSKVMLNAVPSVTAKDFHNSDEDQRVIRAYMIASDGKLSAEEITELKEIRKGVTSIVGRQLLSSVISNVYANDLTLAANGKKVSPMGIAAQYDNAANSMASEWLNRYGIELQSQNNCSSPDAVVVGNRNQENQELEKFQDYIKVKSVLDRTTASADLSLSR